MDVELEKMQFLGICGILQETNKLIQNWRKIFTQITLAFILPLSLLIFANIETSHFFVRKITHDQLVLQQTQKSTPKFQKLSGFSNVFSLPSTSAVVYTVACIYTARDVSFKHVITVVPKLWNRLIVTFLCVVAAFFAFNFVASSVLFLIRLIAVVIYGPNDSSIGAGIGTIRFFFFVFYCVGFWYLTIIWQLSSVVSVLEDSYGLKAMAKSKALVKGKMMMVTWLLMVLNLPFGAVQFLFHYLVFQSSPSQSPGVVGRGILGIIWILSFLLFFLVNLVAETVLYFVCKSYHHESVDKSALSDHLQGYLFADYVPLKVDDDVRVEKLHVV